MAIFKVTESALSKIEETSFQRKERLERKGSGWTTPQAECPLSRTNGYAQDQS